MTRLEVVPRLLAWMSCGHVQEIRQADAHRNVMPCRSCEAGDEKHYQVEEVEGPWGSPTHAQPRTRSGTESNGP